MALAHYSKRVTREGRLSRDLKKILEKKSEASFLTVGQLRQVLKGRGFALLIILFALPFLLPIPLPGLSTPFGLAIAFLGFRMALGKRPWFPERIQHIKISYSILEKIIAKAVRVAVSLEKVIKPRLSWMRHRGLARLIGFVIMINGSLLCLPLPYPLTRCVHLVSSLFLRSSWDDTTLSLWTHARVLSRYTY